VSSVLSKSVKLNKWRSDFMIEILMLYLVIPQRINFLQMGRYSQYGEQRFRQQFERKFDFLAFNRELVAEFFGKRVAIAFDPSFISKSGKKTPYIGHFWSGCAGTTKRGLEISGIGAIDIDMNQCLHLEAIQTAPPKTLNTVKMTLIDWYASILKDRKEQLQVISSIVVADAYFSKYEFVEQLTQNDFHLISRLRDDADLRYIYTGQRTGKKGAPKKYEGKILLNELNLAYFTSLNYKSNIEAYSAIVYSKSLKRNILLVIERIQSNDKVKQRLIFSTDIHANPTDVLDYYHCRFQIEFCYRDAKQAVGLNHSQARSLNKLNFHFNASLTSVNIAKVTHWKNRKDDKASFSISDAKTLLHNAFIINRFINLFGINPNSIKNHKHINELLYYGTIAA